MKLSHRIAPCAALLALVSLSACEDAKPAPDEPAATVTPEKVDAGAVTKKSDMSMAARDVARDSGDRYPLNVGQAVDKAVYEGLYASMRDLVAKVDPRTAEYKGAPARPAQADKDRARGTMLTIFHTSNVRGEREDCGCKKNPRGGLARKATLIADAARSNPADTRPDATLIVDGGDLLFKSTRVGALAEGSRKNALIEAEAVVDSFNIIGCDGFAVGEYDVALGVDELEKLSKRAKFPFLSANLRKKGASELLFDSHKLVTAGEHKILLVGLTNPDSSVAKYYEDMGLQVSDPKEALEGLAEVVKANQPNAILLLSNLGVAKTQDLIRAIGDGPTRPDLAVVSGTSRSTYTPVWEGATPIFEASSRGKFLGRVDLHIVDGKFAFTPAETAKAKSVRDYMNGYRSLHVARKNLAEAKVKKLDEKRIERLDKNLEFALTRLETVERGLPASLTAEKAVESPNWINNQVVPVELKIAQQPKVRAVLDEHIRRTGKDPNAKKPSLPSPAALKSPALKKGMAKPSIKGPAVKLPLKNLRKAQ